MHQIWQAVLNFIDNVINWFDNLFDIDPNDRPKQLIPVRHDKSKPAKNINHNNYEKKLLKMFFLFITMLLLMLVGANLGFDN